MRKQFGAWWLPEEPTRRLQGSIDYGDDDDASVSLVGDFERPISLTEEGPIAIRTAAGNRYPVVLGELADGAQITLSNSIVMDHSAGLFGRQASLRLSPEVVIRGAHFCTQADFAVSEMFFRTADLDTWVQSSGLTLTMYPNAPTPSFSVKYEMPEATSFPLSEGLRGEVCFRVRGPQLSANTTEANLRQQAWLRLESVTPLAYDIALEWVRRVLEFVSLGVGRAQGLELGSVRGTSTTLEVVDSRRWWVPSFDKPVEPHDVLFSFPEIRECLSDNVRQWLAPDPAISPLLALYFGTLRSERMYVEHRLFNFYQALESYHRRTYILPEEKATKHVARLGRILGMFDNDQSAQAKMDKDWLTDALRHSNQPAAAERLRLICKSLDADWVFDDAIETIELAARLRNYYTHYDARLEEKLPPEADRPRLLNNLAVRLQVLCELILLRKAGFEPSTMKDRYAKSGRLRRLLARR